MGYIKTLWANRQGTGLNRFRKSGETSTHVALVNDPESVTEQGTPVSIENLNKMEQGIYDAHEIASGKVDKINVTPLTAIAAKKIAYNAQGQITGSSDLTKADLSLGNVTNDAQVRRNEMGAANGVATLDGNGTIPTAQLPNLGQGLTAVTADSTLRGNGTPNLPLGVSLPTSSVISLSEDNQESALSAKYGGTWVKSLDPAPVIHTSVIGGASYEERNLTAPYGLSRRTEIPTVPGANLVLNIVCADGFSGFVTVRLTSTVRGVIYQHINSIWDQLQLSFSITAQSFETVVFEADFPLILQISSSARSVRWGEYKYVRLA